MNIKISPFECSETFMINLFNKENFPFQINQYFKIKLGWDSGRVLNELTLPNMFEDETK